MADLKHHMFGPSSLERRMLCPGSFAIESQLENPPSNKYAEEGAKLHRSIELADFDGLDENQMEMVTGCLNWLDKRTDVKDVVYYEKTMSLIGPAFDELCFGTVDVVIVGKTLRIVDWKFGFNPVEYAKDNIQLATLAAMAMQKYGYDSCEVSVVQPRIGRWNDSYTFTDLSALITSISGVIETAKAPGAPCIPGEKQCKYCRGCHWAACPSLSRETEWLSETAEKTKPAELDDNELATLYHSAKTCASFLEKLKYQIKKRCEANKSCGGLALKTTSGGRECEDITRMYGVLGDHFEHEEFLKFCSVSVSKLETAFAKSRKEAGAVKTQKAGKEEFAELVGHLVKGKAPKVSIVKTTQ